MVIQAVSGKWASTASRHWVTGRRNVVSLLHGTCWTRIRPSAEPKMVPLNSRSSGISPSSSELK